MHPLSHAGLRQNLCLRLHLYLHLRPEEMLAPSTKRG